jgi:hypothetical protein
MTLRIQYSDGKYDYVDSRTLDRLIDTNQVKFFYRPSEKKWIDVDTDAVRGKIRFYRFAEKKWVNLDVSDTVKLPSYIGPERRTAPVSASKAM